MKASSGRLTHAQAAEVLGVHVTTVPDLIARGDVTPVRKWAKAGLLRSDVKRLSLMRWQPGDRTWLTTTHDAEVLGVTRALASQLAERGFLPYERTPDGRRVPARRRSRWWMGTAARLSQGLA